MSGKSSKKDLINARLLEGAGNYSSEDIAMENEQQSNCSSQECLDDSAVSVTSRRRWVTGAAGAVLLSVKAGGALAQGVCASPSGFKSIQANPQTSHKPTNSDGSCHSHGYYAGHPERMGQFQTATLAQYQLNRPTDPPNSLTSNSTFVEVIQINGDFANARDLITALVDNLLGAQNVLMVADVQDMWVICYGGILPQGSAFSTWTQLDVRAYLNVYVGKTTL